MPITMKNEKSEMKIKNLSNSEEDEIYDPSDYEAEEAHSIVNVKKGRPPSGPNIDRRRQIHVKCEHRRRKEIQDTLEALEAELPEPRRGRSKSAIIFESAELIKDLTFTLDRLLNENQTLLNRAQVDELTK